MAKPTLEKYLNYMGETPRTFGWGALLVYDRFRTNRLLAHEHIERFDKGSWLAPITTSIKTEEGTWTQLNNLMFDKPRLSFVNSNIGGSKARLSMNAISGEILQLHQATGSPNQELTHVSTLDPLTGPTVRMDIDLNNSGNGQVGETGRVTLDLSRGSAYTFEVSNFNDLNDKVGAAMKLKFDERPPEERVWELNTLQRVDGQLNPTSFAVRTHSLARAGNALASSDPDEQEEGAVLVGIAFDGEAAGSFPTQDEDLPYLLPEAVEGEEYSVNFIIGNKVWMTDLVGTLAERFEYISGLRDQPDGSSFINKVGTISFPVPADKKRERHEFRWGAVEELEWPAFTLEGTYQITMQDNALVVEWDAVGESVTWVLGYITDRWHTGRKKGHYRVTNRVRLVPELGSPGDTAGTVKLVLDEGFGPTAGFIKDEDDLESGYTADAAEFLCDPVVTEIQRVVAAKQSELLNAIGLTIDVMRFHGILFRGQEIAAPRTVYVPGDMSLLGTLAPNLTAFAIEPLETTVSAGQTLKFSASPDQVGLHWDVQPLPGDSGAVGTITTSGGVYTAPAVDEIEGGLKRVIVSATSDGNTSRALVTVVSSAISVFPRLMTAQYSDEGTPNRYVLVGGSIEGALTWTMASGSKGELREAQDGEPGLVVPEDKNVRIYEAPTRQPEAGRTIGALMHVDRAQVSHAGETGLMDIVIPWRSQNGWLQAEALDGGAVEVSLWYEGWKVQADKVEPADCIWGVLVGSGKFDEAKGIYSPGDDEGPYVIIAALEKGSSSQPTWAYSVLPMPYFAPAVCKEV